MLDDLIGVITAAKLLFCLSTVALTWRNAFQQGIKLDTYLNHAKKCSLVPVPPLIPTCTKYRVSQMTQ
jgi:hypothetical protein